jgi:hypothetical protein
MGENFLAPIPTAVYGAILLMPAIAYYLLQKAIMRKQGPNSVLANALGSDIKGKTIGPKPPGANSPWTSDRSGGFTSITEEFKP